MPTSVVSTGEPETNQEDTEFQPIDTEIPEDTATDTALEPSEECPGYVIHNGFWDYDDEGHGTAQYVEVESLALFTPVGDTDVESTVGSDVTFSVAVTALTCGDVKLHTLFFVVEDYEGNEWLVEINNDQIESGYLREVSTDTEFTPITPGNMYVTPMGDELFYEWCAEELGDTRCTDISTRDLPAGTSEIYQFTFSPGEYAPVGTTFEIHLAEAIWTDVTTGELIWDTLWSDVPLNVTVVE